MCSLRSQQKCMSMKPEPCRIKMRICSVARSKRGTSCQNLGVVSLEFVRNHLKSSQLSLDNAARKHSFTRFLSTALATLSSSDAVSHRRFVELILTSYLLFLGMSHILDGRLLSLRQLCFSHRRNILTCLMKEHMRDVATKLCEG